MSNNSEGESKKSNEFNIFDIKSLDELIDKLTLGFSKTLEKEVKEQIKKLKVEYARDEQNAINTGITAKAEEKAKEWICPRIPNWVTPDMLTFLGVVSALVIAAGFVLGFFNRYYLILVVVGLIAHWFGDSFDGSLARYRKKTRPHYGYYIDHIVDGVAVMFLSLGMGLSGFVKIEFSLLFAILYILFILHVELVTYVQNEFKYSIGLIGATEMRIIGILFTVVMFFLPVKYFNIYGHYITQYDIAVLGACIIMFVLVVITIIRKGVELDRIDRKKWVKGS